jgi:hypothetical protein
MAPGHMDQESPVESVFLPLAGRLDDRFVTAVSWHGCMKPLAASPGLGCRTWGMESAIYRHAP